MTIPLQSKLRNGATVSDWLGTAKTQAFVAAGLIEDVREDRKADPLQALIDAEEYLENALKEVRAVKRHAALVGSFGDRQL